jgi:hypothetical protein
MARMAWLFAIAVLLGSSATAHAQRKRAPARSAASHKPAEAADASAPAPPGIDPQAAAPDPAPGASPVAPAKPALAAVPAGGDSAGSTAGATAATKDGESGKPGDRAEVAALQQELAQLMDDLVQARGRVAVLGKALFRTKVRLRLDFSDSEDQVLGKVALRLDGAPIFSGDGAALGDPERPLFEGFAAPGPHVLEVEIEQRARADEAYRYTLRESYRFEVVGERRTDLRLVLEDDSDIAEDFRDDRSGEYDVHTRLQVQAVALNEE